ncbi:MAG: response regulator [Proteobacteria bacterium]|nr:response regulator [Pseudomonadota bacterium]
MSLKTILPTEKTTILAVDDNPAALRLIQLMLERGDYRVLTAVNGRDALAVLAANVDSIDIILLDRLMPEMDGLEVCEKIRADDKLRAIPIIMQTAAGRPQEIKEGIEAGVFYYLVKPLNSETLLSIVASARQKLRKYRQNEHENLQRQESLALVQSMKCFFKTTEEGDKLATFLAQFFPNPDLALPGISELFLNAVEHGNLAISYELKSELVQTNRWKEEVDKRLTDPLYRDRVVTVLLEKTDESCSLRIHDEGEGFSWEQYLHVDPSRATHNHGRGIAMANMMSFDELIFNVRGNQVTGIVYYHRS